MRAIKQKIKELEAEKLAQDVEQRGMEAERLAQKFEVMGRMKKALYTIRKL